MGLQFPQGISSPPVLKNVLNFYLGPPSPGGSRGRVRTVISLGASGVLGRFRAGSGGLKYLLLAFWP